MLRILKVLLLHQLAIASAFTPRPVKSVVRLRGVPASEQRSSFTYHDPCQRHSASLKAAGTSITEPASNKHLSANTTDASQIDSKDIEQDDLLSRIGSTKIQIGASITYLTSAITLAKLNLLGPYTDTLLYRDLGATVFSTVAAFILVKSLTKLSTDGIVEARDSRKIIHTLCAPSFLVVWPLFSDVYGARFFAGFVAGLQGLRLWLAGTRRGGSDGNELAGAISRSGNSKEALGGPFIYTLILFSSIMLFFTDNLTGVIALSSMAAGDGMADIVGRRFGKNNKWPFSSSKSIAGSLAFIVFSSLCAIGLGTWLQYTGTISTVYSFGEMTSKIVFISFASAMVELLPFGDDNWNVPLAAAALSMLLLP